jgi:alanine racemase
MSLIDEYHADHPGRLPLRPTRVWIDGAALQANLRLVGGRSGLGVQGLLAVVKANGYGHGLLEAARSFAAAGVGGLAVGFVEEGVRLRREGLELPLLVMGGLVDYQIPVFLDYDLQMTVSSAHKARQVDACIAALPPARRRPARVHLKIDLDMERIGVHAASARAFVHSCLELPNLRIAGVYSHLANADRGEVRAVEQPLARLLALRESLRGLLPADCRWHLANSAAAVRFPQTALDLARPGLLLYGVDPSGEAGRLLPEARPALSWRSAVVYFKVIEAGAGVSYGHLWRAPRRTRLVTVPVGYGDGYPRGLTGKAEVLIRGRRLPVVGAICMDQLMVDIGPEGTAYNGDEVVLIGRQGEQSITVEDLARWQGTIPYEILTGIADRVPRQVLAG